MKEIKHILAIITVFVMILSSLPLYPVVSGDEPVDRGDGVLENSGDWLIESGETYTFAGKTIVLNGNLTVNGTLTLKDCEVSMNRTATILVNGALNLLNTSITGNSTYYAFIVHGGLLMKNSTLSNMSGSAEKPYTGGLQIYSENVSIDGGSISDCEFTGLYLTTNITIMNLTVEHNFFNVVVNNASPYFINSAIQYPDSVSLYMLNNASPSLVDAEIIGEKRFEDDTSSLNICHLMNVSVELENGTPIAGAVVDIVSTDSQVKLQRVTDSSGRVERIILPEYTQHKSTSDSYHAPYILSAKRFGLSVAKSVPFDASTDVLMVLSGDNFGHSITLGDFNGDGRTDIAAGVPRNTSGVSRPGAVFVYLNDGGLEFKNITESGADIRIVGVEGMEFGESVAAGDINGDGFCDLLVGAPDYDSGKGRVYFFYGSSAPHWQNTGDADFYLDGKSTAGFGSTILCADFNKDGYSDFAIGDRDHTFVYYGSADPKNDYTGVSHVVAHPTSKGPLDNTGQALSKLERDDDDRYDVNPPASGQNKLNVLNFSVAGLKGEITQAELKIQYITDQYYGYYQSERGWLKGRIGPDDDWHNLLRPTDHHNSEATEEFDLLANGVDTPEKLQKIEIYFENLDGTAGGSNQHYIHFDYIVLDITAMPPGPNHTLEKGNLSSGDVNGDNYSDLIISDPAKQVVYYGGINGLGAPELISMDEHEGNATRMEVRNGNLTISKKGTVPNGYFDNGWEHWYQEENPQGQKDAEVRWAIVTETNGDWWAHNGPTAGFGSPLDTLSNENTDSSKNCRGRLRSEVFTIPDYVETIHFWYHFKYTSFDAAGGGQGSISDYIKYRLFDASNDSMLKELAGVEGGNNGEDSGEVNESVVDIRGKEVYLAIDIYTNFGRRDKAIAQIDDVELLPLPDKPYYTNASFVSEWLNFNRNVTILTPEWKEYLNNGTITVKFRTGASEDWGNISPAVSGESIGLSVPSNRLQYRVDMTGNGSSTPLLSELTINYLCEGQMRPLDMATDYGLVKAGDINGDGMDDLVFLKNGDLYMHQGSRNLSADFNTNNITLFHSGNTSDFSFIDLERDGRDEIVSAGSRVEVLNSTGDAVFTDEREGIRCFRNLISDPYYHLNSGRVFLIPASDRDVRVLDLRVPALIPPGENRTINVSVGNAGIKRGENLTLRLHITAAGYSFNATQTVNLSSMEMKKLAFLWPVPPDEGVNYLLTASIAMTEDRVPENNLLNATTTSMRHALSLHAPETFRKAHGGDFMEYSLLVNNTGTFPRENATLSFSLPAGWTGEFLYNGTPIHYIAVSDSVEIVFRAKSPYDEQNGDFILNISATAVTALVNLSVTARVLRPDLIVDEIALFREDGVRTNSTLHGVEGENATVRVHVLNQGPTYSAPFNLTLYIDGKEERTFRSGGMAGGEGIYFDCHFVPAAGNRTISADVDSGDEVPEENEDNNNLSSHFLIKDRTPVGNYTLTGTVQNIFGEGVKNALITLAWEGKNDTLLTDANGSFSYRFDAADYHDASLLYLNATDGENRTDETIILYSEDGGKAVVLTLRQYLVELTGEDTIYSIEMGGNLTIRLKVKNTGNTNTTFLLRAAEVPDGWSVDFPELSGGLIFLNTGEEREVSAVVTASSSPLQSAGYERYFLTFLASSVLYPEANDTVTQGVEVMPFHSLRVVLVDGGNLTAEPGDNLSIPLQVENSGNIRDTLIPEVQGLTGADYSFNISYAVVDTGKSALFHLDLRMPEIPAGDVLNLSIGGKNAQNATVIIEALPHYSISCVPPAGITGIPGKVNTLPLTLINTGNIQENISIEWEGPGVQTGNDSQIMDMGEERLYNLYVTLPEEAQSGEVIPLMLTLSTGDFILNCQLNITVKEVYGFSMEIKDLSILPDEEFTVYRYFIEFRNTGNGKNTYLLNAAGDYPEFVVLPDPITLGAGEGIELPVDVVIPLNLTGGGDNYLVPVDIMGRQYPDIDLRIPSYSMNVNYSVDISQHATEFVYNITLRNDGERFERLHPVLTLPEEHWYGEVNREVAGLMPGESKVVKVYVTPPEYREYWGDALLLTLSSDSGRQMVIELHKPPIAKLGAEIPSTVTFESELTFTGSLSLWNIREYLWDFGDGTNASGTTVKHSFARAGVFTVTLTVVDDMGLKASKSIEITVENTPPLALIVTTPLNATVEEGKPITFDASYSTDRDGEIVSYHWDFGDSEKGDYVVEEHIYSKEGQYTVTLTVADDMGDTSQKTIDVKVVKKSETSGPATPTVIEKTTTDPITYLPALAGIVVLGAGVFIIYRKHGFIRMMQKKVEEERKKKA